MSETMKVDLSDLSEGQVSRLRYEPGCKPVVDCGGSAIGVARNVHGAKLITAIMANARMDEIDVVERADYFVIGGEDE